MNKRENRPAMKKPPKTNLNTFLDSDTLALWAERMVKFVNANESVLVARSLERAFEDEARSQAHPLAPSNVSDERYKKLHNALRTYLLAHTKNSESVRQQLEGVKLHSLRNEKSSQGVIGLPY